MKRRQTFICKFVCWYRYVCKVIYIMDFPITEQVDKCDIVIVNQG